jgi:hypothetical protein
VPAVTAGVVTRFVASDVNTIFVPVASIAGCELCPLAGLAAGEPDTREVAGTQPEPPTVVTVAWARQVSRRKIWLPVLFWPSTRLFELEAKATNSPVPLTEGPDEVRGGRFGTSPAEALLQFVRPSQIPLFAGDPS